MSKDICLGCKKVINTTSDQGLTVLARQEDLEYLDSMFCDETFSSMYWTNFKGHARKAYICDECWKDLYKHP